MGVIREPVQETNHWTLGCDIGKLRDRTCIAAIERRRVGTDEWEPINNSAVRWREKSKLVYFLRYLEKLPLNVNYIDQAVYISSLCKKPPNQACE